MSELPKKVRINGIEYRVSVREADYKLGHCDYTNCEIVIHSKQDDARKAKVLVHEILHGALYEAGLEDMNNEATVTKLEGVLYDSVGWVFGKMKDHEKRVITDQKMFESKLAELLAAPGGQYFPTATTTTNSLTPPTSGERILSPNYESRSYCGLPVRVKSR